MKKIIVLCISLLMVMGVAGAASAAPILSFDLTPMNDNIIAPLGSITIDIFAVITDDTTPSIQYALQSFGFELEYDASLLNVTSSSIDPQWNFGATVNDTSTDGLVRMAKAFFNFTPPPFGVGSPAHLGSISFVGEGAGLSNLTIFDLDRGGTVADFALSAPNEGTDLDNQISSGVVIGSINQVPIPGSILLLGSGLVGLVGLVRRKRS